MNSSRTLCTGCAASRLRALALFSVIALTALACEAAPETPSNDVSAGTDAAAGTDATAATDATAGTDATVATDVTTQTDGAADTDASAGTDATAETDVSAISDTPVTDIPLVCDKGFEKKDGQCIDINECTKGPGWSSCPQKSHCVNTEGAYDCECDEGYSKMGKLCCAAGYQPNSTGTSCEDINECTKDLDDCSENATCYNNPGKWSCTCKAGYTGDGKTCTKPEPTNPCTNGTATCSKDATCAQSGTSYTCTCKEGFTGDGKICCGAGYKQGAPGGYPCEDVNECTLGTDDCSDNATCYNKAGGFSCTCKSGFTGDGKTCTAIAVQNPCNTGTFVCDKAATCVPTGDTTYKCECPADMNGDGKVCCGAGYKQGPPGGYACEDVNECLIGTHDCSPNAACYNQPGTWKCACNAGFVGDGKSCEATTAPDPCAGTTSCSKDATCSASTSGYDCTCKEGFTGNGKVCCGDGYVLNATGNLCNDINECTANTDNCSDNAYCYNNAGSFSCQCKSGYTGDGITCTAIDPNDPCTSGTPKCGAHATCTTTGATTYDCDCDPGYTGNGKVCCAEGFLLNEAGTLCNDINECDTNGGGCGENALCYNNAGSFACQCGYGYVGDGYTCVLASTLPSNPCTDGTAQCGANSTCVQTIGGYNCACNTGYTLSSGACVAVSSDPCAGTTQCSPNATCAKSGNGYTCTCKSGYIGNGTTCTAGSADPCADGTNDCDDNATCTKTSAGYLCKCKTGYTGNGKSCTEIDECALNTDTCSHTCTNEPAGSYTCSCPTGYKLNGGYCADINECSDPVAVGCYGKCENIAGSFYCFGKGGISSIEDPNTPYPETQCAGSVGPEAIWFQTHKTTFPVDCRCPPGSSQPGAKFCAAPFGTAFGGVKIGTGVSAIDHTSANIQGCATNYTAKTVYFGVNWGNNGDSSRGYIMAVDPTTGNRTIVSGDYFSPADGVVSVGTGNKFDIIKDMALGPDGLLYVFEDSVPNTSLPDDTNPDLQGRSIYSVDLTTGNRNLVWNHQTWNHPEFVGCANGQPVSGNPIKTTDVQIHGFELFENGDFLLATNANVNPSEGEGFIRVGKDGKSCTWITRSSTKSGNLLFGDTTGAGSGVDVAAGFDSGFGYKDGYIYATAFLTGSIYKVEVATGKRSMIWNGAQPSVGTGPGPGVWHFFYYPLFGLWVAGGNELGTPSNASLFDPASGDTWSWMYKKPDGAIDPTGASQMGVGNDAYVGPLGIQTNQLRGPILGAKYETLSDRPWCISPIAPNRLLVATDSVGVVIVEVETGNTMNFSL